MLTMTGVQVIRSGKTCLTVEELSLPEHSFLGLIGPNGAGKTTFLHLCMGLLKPTHGKVFLNQQPVSPRSLSLGYVPQETEYNRTIPLSVREIIATGLPMQTWPPTLTAQHRRQIDHVVSIMGISNLMSRTFRSLSGGEQKKVVIARALVPQPSLLVLDEPLTNLDFDWRSEILSLVEQYYQSHPVTVLLVSHDTMVLPACATHLGLLKAGRLLALDTIDRLLQGQAFQTVFNQRLELRRIDNRYCVLPAAMSLLAQDN